MVVDSLRIPHPLGSSVAAHGQGAALTTAGNTLSWQQLHHSVTVMAAQLAQWGVQPGDTVALYGGADADFVVMLHAVGWLGAVAAPLNRRASALELQTALVATAAQWLICCEVLGESERCALQAATTLRVHGPVAEMPVIAPLPERFWPLDEVRLVLCSSGSTAAPKAVRLTVAQLLFSAMGHSWRVGHLPADSWLLCLPLHHIGGLSVLLRALWSSTHVLLHGHFDACMVAQVLDAGLVQGVSLVPTMLQQVFDARPLGPFHPHLRVILLGGAAASAALLERARAMGAPVAVTWGMTETASQIATTQPGDHHGPGDCGAPLAFARVDHVDAHFRVRGPIAPGGQQSTTDWGEIDPDGRIWVRGRIDDVLISGGENIVPQEIEAVLLHHPAVRDAVVVGQHDPRWGQRPVALLVLQEAAHLPSDHAMDSWCRQSLTAFKVPVRFVWRAQLRNALGKVNRKQLAASLGAPIA